LQHTNYLVEKILPKRIKEKDEIKNL